MKERTMLGEIIYVRRQKLGLTQKELAEKLGISNKAVSKWENLESNPEISQLKPLSEILQISVDELLSGETSAFASTEQIAINENKQSENLKETKSEIKKPTKKQAARFVFDVIAAIVCSLAACFSLACTILTAIEKRPDLNYTTQTWIIVTFTILTTVFIVVVVYLISRAVLYSQKLTRFSLSAIEMKDGWRLWSDIDKSEQKELNKALTRRCLFPSVILLLFSIICIILAFVYLWKPPLTAVMCSIASSTALIANSITFYKRRSFLNENKIVTSIKEYEKMKRSIN